MSAVCSRPEVCTSQDSKMATKKPKSSSSRFLLFILNEACKRKIIFYYCGLTVFEGIIVGGKLGHGCLCSLVF